MRLVRASVSADPPVRPLMHEYSGVLRINLTSGTTSEIVSAGSVGSPARATIAKSGKLAISLEDVRKLIIGFMGYASDTTFEINIRKVSVWGPISGDSAPRLAVDLSDISGGIIVTDKCGKNHRARMAVTSPFNLWQKPSNVSFCSYDPAGSIELELGVLDISSAWRRFAL